MAGGGHAHMRAMLATAAVASAMFIAVVMMSSLKAHRTALVQQELYNKWGTKDDNDHWGGVGSENYHTAKWDNTGSNVDYHPRDSSSGDGDSMEPAWWRQGPGANSEYTGHAMDGELYSPPDEKIFKPFFMKQKGARASQLFDVDGPSPSDPPRSAWAAAGKGTTDWMLHNEGPLLASVQEQMPDEKKDRKEQEQHRAQTQTAKQVERAEHPRPDLAKIRAAYAKSRALAHKQAPKLAYSNRNVHLETKGLDLKLISKQAAERAKKDAKPHVQQQQEKEGAKGELMSDRQKAMQKALAQHQAEMERALAAHLAETQKQLEQQPKPTSTAAPPPKAKKSTASK